MTSVQAFLDTRWPAYEVAARALAAGELPLWDPVFFCGQPLLANMQHGLFYPGALIFLFTSSIIGWCLFTGLHLALSLAGSRRLGDLLGLDRPAAWVMAGSWTVCTLVVLNLERPMLLAALAWLPWLLVQRKPPAQGLTLALILVTGAWEIAVAGLVLLALYEKKEIHSWLVRLLVSALAAAPAIFMYGQWIGSTVWSDPSAGRGFVFFAGGIILPVVSVFVFVRKKIPYENRVLIVGSFAGGIIALLVRNPVLSLGVDTALTGQILLAVAGMISLGLVHGMLVQRGLSKYLATWVLVGVVALESVVLLNIAHRDQPTSSQVKKWSSIGVLGLRPGARHLGIARPDVADLEQSGLGNVVANRGAQYGLRYASGISDRIPRRMLVLLNYSQAERYPGNSNVLSLLGITRYIQKHPVDGYLKLERYRRPVSAALVNLAYPYDGTLEGWVADRIDLFQRPLLVQAGREIESMNGEGGNNWNLVYPVEKSVSKLEIQLPPRHQGGWLYIGNAWWPGWKASVNGVATSIYKAEMAFQALAVKEGDRTVVFEYHPDLPGQLLLGTSILLFMLVFGAFLPLRLLTFRP